MKPKIGKIIDIEYDEKYKENYVIFENTQYLIIKKSQYSSIIHSLDLKNVKKVEFNKLKLRILKYKKEIYVINLYYQTKLKDGDIVIFEEIDNRLGKSIKIPPMGTLDFKLDFLILEQSKIYGNNKILI